MASCGELVVEGDDTEEPTDNKRLLAGAGLLGLIALGVAASSRDERR